MRAVDNARGNMTRRPIANSVIRLAALVIFCTQFASA
jgi:hypothetical protein